MNLRTEDLHVDSKRLLCRTNRSGPFALFLPEHCSLSSGTYRTYLPVSTTLPISSFVCARSQISRIGFVMYTYCMQIAFDFDDNIRQVEPDRAYETCGPWFYFMKTMSSLPAIKVMGIANHTPLHNDQPYLFIIQFIQRIYGFHSSHWSKLTSHSNFTGIRRRCKFYSLNLIVTPLSQLQLIYRHKRMVLLT